MRRSLSRSLFNSGSLPALLVALLIVPASARAPQGGSLASVQKQSSASKTGKYTLNGIVVNSVTGEPIRRAFVENCTMVQVEPDRTYEIKVQVQ
jgi:hypothetical protein